MLNVIGFANRARRRELLKVFKSNDWRTLAALSATPVDPKVAEVAFHKARAAADWCPDALRRESAEWLKQRGFAPLFGRDPA